LRYKWWPVSIVVLDGVTLSFGSRAVLDDIGLRVGEHDRIGLVGPNGSGKTTLLRVLAKEQAPDKGSIQRSKRSRLGYLPQDLAVDGGISLIDFVLASVPGRADLDSELAEVEAELESAQGVADDETLMGLAERIADIHERIDHFERFFAEHEALRILAGLGFVSRDRTRDLGEFSGGWKMRAVLASLLFQQPDLLLMDEPTNHLDMPSVAWLSDFLARYKRAFILISHDREFLNEQINRVVSFEPEGLRQYSGNYDQYVRQRAEEEEVLINKARNLQKERERRERFVERFRAKASKARQAQSRAKQLARMEEVETLEIRQVMRIKFPEVPRTVNEVVKIKGLRKAYGEHVVFPGIDLRVQRGEKIGIIGPNGAGKTTLLKILAGELAADAGEVVIGSNVQVGYYAQHHAETLHAESTAFAEVQRANPDATPTQVRSVLGAFLFSGDDVDKPIGVLSGGERARVALARLLINPGALLLMDEPTNHLDLQSSESLAQSLVDYGGTLVFVSHNRSLIRTLATRIWNIEAGMVETYPGTLDEYMYSQRMRLEAEGQAVAASNSRSKHPPAAPPPRPAPAPAVTGSAGPAGETDASRGKNNRADERERKRREAETRQRRSQLVGPIQKRIDRLEGRVAELERAQAERSTQLSDPAIYDDAATRNRLLDEYQKAAAKLEELQARWEAAMQELEEAEATLAQ
jgi:ATP-binding cassette, subfamily F, member 3